MLLQKHIFYGLVAVSILGFFFSVQKTFAVDEATTKILQEKYGISPEESKNLGQEYADAILNTPIKVTPGATPFDHLLTEEEKNSSTTLAAIPKASDDVARCFAYYRFGSVSADITARSSNPTAGSNMHFTGSIKNDNSYPVVDGTLYVKIFKITGDGSKNSNGPDVIDQFAAVQDISIPANGEMPFEFFWKIPSYTEGGNYRIVTFFQTAEAFNLLGLSFTDDVVGNKFDFAIKNTKQNGFVSFNKGKVTVDGKPYYFAAFPPRVDKEKPVTIVSEIKNSTSEKQYVNVAWKVYRWDALKQENQLHTEITTVEVKPKSTANASLIVPYNEHPVYLVEAKLGYKDTSSILNIRFVREGIDRTRINFPSITSYPLTKNQEITIFSCLHNSGSSSFVDKGKLVLTLLDVHGKEFHRYEYNGGVTGEMMAVKNTFTPKKTYDSFTLKAELFQNGVLTDTGSHVYDCKKLGRSTCEDTSAAGESEVHPLKSKRVIASSIVVALLIILVLVALRLKNRGLFMLFLILICAGSFLLPPPEAEAKSALWTFSRPEYQLQPGEYPGTNPWLYYFWGEPGITLTGWSPALLGASIINVSYNAEIKLADGTLVKDGDIVPVGSTLSLLFKKHVSTDISWFGSGYSADSPYGEWRDGAAPPSITTIGGISTIQPESCSEKDWVNDFYLIGNGHTYKVYMPLVIAPPTKTITGLTGLSCGSLAVDTNGDYKMTCTVQPNVDPSATIPLNPVFNIAATKGRFYYRYFDTWYGGCHGNNVPLFDQTAAYDLPVGAKTIGYSFSARDVTGNRAPNISIFGFQTGYVGVNYKFNIVAADPDNDYLELGVDWNDDGDINSFDGNINWFMGAFPSGSATTLPRTWTTPGVKTFRVISRDSKGVKSAWKTFSITINPVDPNFDFYLSSNQSLVNIIAGLTTTNTITATKIIGTTKPVSLWVSSIKNSSGVEVMDTISGLVAGGGAVAPNQVSPTATANVTLNSAPGLNQNTNYTVTVSGSSAGSSATVTTVSAGYSVPCRLVWTPTSEYPGNHQYDGFYFGCSAEVGFNPLLNYQAGGTTDSVKCINYDDGLCKNYGSLGYPIPSIGADLVKTTRQTIADKTCGSGNWTLSSTATNAQYSGSVGFVCTNSVVSTGGAAVGSCTSLVYEDAGYVDTSGGQQVAIGGYYIDCTYGANSPLIPVKTSTSGLIRPTTATAGLAEFNEFAWQACGGDGSYTVTRPYVNVLSSPIGGSFVCNSTSPGITRTTSFTVAPLDPYSINVSQGGEVCPLTEAYITVSWMRVPGAVNYTLLRQHVGTPDVEITVPDPGSGTWITYNDPDTNETNNTGLISGDLYSYTVRANLSTTQLNWSYTYSAYPSQSKAVCASTVPVDYEIKADPISIKAGEVGEITLRLEKIGAVDGRITSVTATLPPPSTIGTWKTSTGVVIPDGTARQCNSLNVGSCVFKYSIATPNTLLPANHLISFTSMTATGIMRQKWVIVSITSDDPPAVRLSLKDVNNTVFTSTSKNIKVKKDSSNSLTWVSTGPVTFDTCAASSVRAYSSGAPNPGWAASRGDTWSAVTTGTKNNVIIGERTTFTITCTKAGTTVSDSLDVEVIDTPRFIEI